MTPAIAVKEGTHRRVTGDLGALFGIEIDADASLEKPLEKPLKTSGNTSRKTSHNTSRKTSAKKTAPTAQAPEPIAKPFKATRTSIVRLRKQFGMTQVQFAQLLNVSVATLRSWEESTLPLKLQTRSLQALERVAKLSKDDAWKAVDAT
jgi:DNA-binding transcriptional regulator YiaG